MSEQLLGDLRGRFRTTSRLRLDEMSSLLAQLEGEDAGSPLLHKLATHFHGLAGMGATYGYPRVSELGDEAEGMILPLLGRGGKADAVTVARWQAIVGEISALLDQG